MEKEKKSFIDREIDLFTESGAEIVIKYKIEEDEDDDILDDFRKNWKDRDIWYVSEWCDIYCTINGHCFDEVDLRKVIAAKYY